MNTAKPISLEKVKTYPIRQRLSKVSVKEFGSGWTPGGTIGQWLEKLPNILAGKDFRALLERLTTAVREKKTIILAMGAHPIKVGLSPVILDLMERGIISGLAMNGAGIIHDLEIAMVGATSEDVVFGLDDGKFGMATETGEFLNAAIREGAKKGSGLGASVGQTVLRASLPYAEYSLLAGAARLKIPITVHVAIGTDIIHMHPAADGSSIGETSHRDFRIFATLVSRLEGGAYINLGSAVILPEVFLKALSLVRNLGFEVKRFTAVDMDFIRHYRPMANVVTRPTREGGQGFSLVGHHEILFPLLASALIEMLERP